LKDERVRINQAIRSKELRVIGAGGENFGVLPRGEALAEAEKANLDYRSHATLKWQPLIEQGFIPSRRIKRIQQENNADVGRFLIPTESCCMNNTLSDTIEYCPVCQLQIIDSICRLSGATPPWITLRENHR